MLKVVLLAMLLAFAAVVVLPEANASNACQQGIVAENTHRCKGAGPCWLEDGGITCKA